MIDMVDAFGFYATLSQPQLTQHLKQNWYELLGTAESPAMEYLSALRISSEME